MSQLPPLPEPSPTHYKEVGLSIERMDMYTADQMRSYAEAAIASMKTKVTEGDEFYQWATHAIGSLAFHNRGEAHDLADKLRTLLSSASNSTDGDRNLLLREDSYPHRKAEGNLCELCAKNGQCMKHMAICIANGTVLNGGK